MGAPPSHPELLDWLAVEFREERLGCEAVLQAHADERHLSSGGVATPEKLEQDRDNACCRAARGSAWMPRWCATMHWPPADCFRREDVRTECRSRTSRRRSGTSSVCPAATRGTTCRTQARISTAGRSTRFWKRMAPPPNLEAFNAPSREVCTVRRERTNTPLQALVTLNDPQFVEAARHPRQTVLCKTVPATIIATMRRRSRRHVPGPFVRIAEQAILLADKAEFLEYYRSHPERRHGALLARRRIARSTSPSMPPISPPGRWSAIRS